MKKKSNLLKKITAFAVVLPIIFFLVTACFKITGVTQPSSIKAGDTMTVTLDVAFDSENNDANYKVLLFGMLVPKSWDAGNNATVRYDSDHNANPEQTGSGPMVFDEGDLSFWKSKSRGADGEISGNTWAKDMEEILGTGENYGEMEWVAFYSENFIDGSQAAFEGTVTIEIKVGDQHSGTQLGYFIGSVGEGLKFEEGGSTPEAASRHYDVEFTDCLTITDAVATATDLCGPPPTFTATIFPDNYLFDDIISIRFDAKEGFEGSNTALFNVGEVFACATAVLSDGSNIVKCVNNESSKMTLIADNLWELTIWPLSYFEIPDGNLMTEIQLNFQNTDGTIVVKNPGYDQDIIFGQVCN